MNSLLHSIQFVLFSIEKQFTKSNQFINSFVLSQRCLVLIQFKSKVFQIKVVLNHNKLKSLVNLTKLKLT